MDHSPSPDFLQAAPVPVRAGAAPPEDVVDRLPKQVIQELMRIPGIDGVWVEREASGARSGTALQPRGPTGHLPKAVHGLPTRIVGGEPIRPGLYTAHGSSSTSALRRARLARHLAALVGRVATAHDGHCLGLGQIHALRAALGLGPAAAGPARAGARVAELLPPRPTPCRLASLGRGGGSSAAPSRRCAPRAARHACPPTRVWVTMPGPPPTPTRRCSTGCWRSAGRAPSAMRRGRDQRPRFLSRAGSTISIQ